nr:MAG TPA: hypothetical protein [Bacteriophage sp.]
MIKPEYLRIGDLVMVSHDCAFPNGTICAVTQIDPERGHEDKKGVVTLSYTDGTDDGPWGAWCNYIEGIPITPEILEKNGFKVRVSRVYYTKLIGDANFLQRNIAIERKRNDWAVFIRYKKMPDSVLLRHIQHVHELQHILWALGLDAELKI